MHFAIASSIHLFIWFAQAVSVVFIEIYRRNPFGCTYTQKERFHKKRDDRV